MEEGTWLLVCILWHKLRILFGASVVLFLNFETSGVTLISYLKLTCNAHLVQYEGVLFLYWNRAVLVKHSGFFYSFQFRKTCVFICKYFVEMWVHSLCDVFIINIYHGTTYFHSNLYFCRLKRLYLLNKWRAKGGVLLIGYSSFRNLSLGRHVKEKDIADEISNALQVIFHLLCYFVSSFYGCQLTILYMRAS